MNKDRFYKISIETPLTNRDFFYTTKDKTVHDSDINAESHAINLLSRTIVEDFNYVSGDVSTYGLASHYTVEEISYDEYIRYMNYFLVVGAN